MMDNFDSLRWLVQNGARFALPYGRSKNKFEENWPEKPHTIEDAIIHAKRGGNVGILTGKYSDNIVAIDRDIDFPQTCEMLGDLSKTAKIVRDNAPERGKLLYRVDDELPPSTVWKVNPTDKHPACEFLAKGRHALVDPSMFDGGRYRLIDTDYGIQQITLVELDYIWRLITGGSLHKEQRTKEEAEEEKTNKDDFIRQVKNAWPIKKVFEHFQKATHGTEDYRNETRVLGNAGLLISEDGKQWYCHGESIGGDNLDAWAWCRWNKRVDRGNPKMFWDVVNDMAGVAGIARPPQTIKTNTNGYHAPDWAAAPPDGTASATEGKRSKKQTEASKNPKTAEYLSALAELGYTFVMNELDDTIEINGRVISDGIQAEIRSRMRDLGYERIAPMEDAYTAHAYHNRYHPIKEYLESLTWDSEDHIFTLASHFDDHGLKIKYAAGGERGVFLAFLRRWLIGSVAKVYGQAQNPMLVLTGAQGKGKSYFAKWLCSPTPEHHIEESVKPDSNEHNRFLAKKWIWEVGELGATTKRQDIEALKQFLTRVDCDFRTPYARNPVHKPAMASFIGTVNPSAGFLVDPTGNRRYIVVDLAAINWLYAQNVDVNQVWAQAYYLWKSGESPALTEEEKTYQSISNEQHTIEDPYESWVRRSFNIDPLREDWSLTTAQITSELQDKGVRGETRAIQMRLAETLKIVGLRQHANDRPRRWLGISLKFEGRQ